MLHEYILQAIDELEERVEIPPQFRKQDDFFEILTDLIAHESRLEPQQLRITEEEYQIEIKKIIREISDSDNPISDFHSKLDGLENRFEKEHHEFTIMFPWNFNHRGLTAFNPPIELRGLTFNTAVPQYWQKCVEKARQESNFGQFISDLPTHSYTSSPYAYQNYWFVKCEATSQEFAIEKVNSVLAIVMGQILWAGYFRSIPTVSRNTNWQYGLATLQHPICYLVFEKDKYRNYYSSYDLTPRYRFSLTGRNKRIFNVMYPKLPTFKDDLDNVEKHLITAFSAYYSAITEPESNKAFLEYWRCLESATLSQDEKYSASDPLKRARSVARPPNIEISDSRIERLVNKRNTLVHRGGDVSTGSGDLTHLKTLSEAAIGFVVNQKEEYNSRQLRFIFKYGAKSEESILQSKTSRERKIREMEDDIRSNKQEIELLDQIIEWLDIEGEHDSINKRE